MDWAVGHCMVYMCTLSYLFHATPIIIIIFLLYTIKINVLHHICIIIIIHMQLAALLTHTYYGDRVLYKSWPPEDYE